jgi:two-component system cell cycle sensor histidine kinase PleC
MSEVTAEMIQRGPRGGEGGPDRRRQARSVRAMRAQLTADASETAFEGDLLRIYAGSRKSSEIIAASIAVTVACMATFWIDWQAALAWFGFVAVSLAIASALARAFLGRDPRTIAVPVWRRRFVVGEGLQGIAWASIVGLFLRVPGANVETFLFVILLLIGAMNAVTAATVPRAVLAAILPTMLATLATVWHGFDDGTNLPLTMFACGTQLFFLVLASRLHETSLGQIVFRAQKDELIAQLEESKAVSDEARHRAEEANLAKSRFLATMSHELRTPLNAILGFSEVMKGELFGAHVVESYKEYAGDIHSSGEHLLALINEILDLSRIEAGRYELKEDAVSLPALISDCRHLLTLRAHKRDISITESIEPQLPRIWADERAMRQVALNLLTNAIKFTPTGGQIFLKVGWTGAGGQYVSIRDTGPGIPENEMPLVMSSFGRGTLAQKNADEGSGLGLPIVKGLVELHGGHFILRSKVREGTEAIVVLPPTRVMDALPRIDVEVPNRPAA